MTARRSKANVALVSCEHIAGFPVITLAPVLRDAVCGPDIPVEILQRSRCYVHSRALADKWVDSVIWLRTRSRDGWVLDKEVKRKAAQ